MGLLFNPFTGKFTVNVDTKSVVLTNAVGDGVTDDSAAIQTAIDSALDQGFNTVYLGTGVFKCNLVIPENICLKGAGGGLKSNFTIPSAPYNTDIYPTVLIPNSTSLPVVRVNSSYGVSLEDFAIIGSSARVGEGLTFSNNVNYVGSSTIVKHVSVRGFSKGIANYGAVDITFEDCLSTESTFCIYGTGAADAAPSDTCVFLNCVTGGPNATWGFWFNACRGIFIISGDHNLAQHVMYMQGGSVVNWVGANSEQIQDHLFELNSGYLNIQSGRFNVVGGIGGNKALIRATGTTVAYNIGPISYDGTGWNSWPVLVQTAGTEYPTSAPLRGIIQRYTSTAFTTLSKVEYTSKVFKNTVQESLDTVVTDNFIKSYSSPFGQLGWLITTVAGTGGQGRFPSSGLQNLLGALEVVTLSGSGSDIFRVALEKEIISLNTYTEWEYEWWLNVSNAANTKLRAGMYSLDASPTYIPTSGIGITFIGGTDTNIKFEIVVAGVATVVDTGVAIGTLTSSTSPIKIIIRKLITTAGGVLGYVCQIGTNAEVMLTSPSVPSGYYTPALFIGSANANFATARIDRFTLRA